MTIATLQGRIALVTGGSRGIGAAISKALARSGAAVAINYRERAGEANGLVDSIAKDNGRAVAVPADVSQTSAVAKMVERVKSELGPIDILVNNAGIAITRGIDDLSEADFDQTIAISLKSVFLCIQTVLPMMRGRNGAASSTSPRAPPGGLAPSDLTIMHRKPV
jgi:3-oxoacyl-[acyl-carrier protein] reductase